MPALITCGWENKFITIDGKRIPIDGVPHLGEKEKAELLAGYPPHQRDARTKGVPQLGAGAVYPLDEKEFVVEDFDIAAHWPRAFALDVGWNRSAVVWGALDRNTNVLYFYSELYQGRTAPEGIARQIRLRGAWIPGVIDPASAGSSQHDGQRIIDLYRKEGLTLSYADNDVEAGIYDVWQRLQGGTLKVFRSLMNWRQEYRLYRRDPKGTGKVVKPNLPQDIPEGKTAAQFGDHLQDAGRYLVRSGLAVMKTEPAKKKSAVVDENWTPPTGELGWMA